MRKLILLLAVSVLTLAGCAQQQYGDFIDDPATGIYAVIADDAVNHLSDIYLIGDEGFQVDPEILGPLGLQIDAKLRERGYAISTVEGVPLTYVFDKIEASSGQVFRLTLTVGGSLHSRAYWESGASSPWTIRYGEAEQQSGQVLALGVGNE